MLYCSNKSCLSLRLSQDGKEFCVECEEHLANAPDCECGYPLNLKQIAMWETENRVCEGCARRLSDDYLTKCMVRCLRRMMDKIK